MFLALLFIFSIVCHSAPQFISFIWGVSISFHNLSSTHVWLSKVSLTSCCLVIQQRVVHIKPPVPIFSITSYTTSTTIFYPPCIQLLLSSPSLFPRNSPVFTKPPHVVVSLQCGGHLWSNPGIQCTTSSPPSVSLLFCQFCWSMMPTLLGKQHSNHWLPFLRQSTVGWWAGAGQQCITGSLTPPSPGHLTQANKKSCWTCGTSCGSSRCPWIKPFTYQPSSTSCHCQN